MQILFNLLAVAAILLAIKPIRNSNRIIVAILAFLWLWMGIVYHLMFFTGINKAAYVFGAAYVVQGGLFVFAGLIRSDLSFRHRLNAVTIFGDLLVLYALIIYPILGHIIGHAYPKSPTFGLPCPTTIFTFGILLWSDVNVPRYLLVVPFLWSIVGFSAALTLGVTEDMGLLIAGVTGTLVLYHRGQVTVSRG